MAKVKVAHVHARRRPVQRRSRETVEAVLDGVVRVLERYGVGGVTTNRIAEAAGVSIGSVYQYFPDKLAIFDALHDRHVERIGHVIDATLVDHAGDSLPVFVRALFEALVDAHADDAEFHELLSTTVPHGADGTRSLAARLRDAFRIAIAARTNETAAEIDARAFVLAHATEALAHGVAYGRSPRLSISHAKRESLRALLAYLRS
jgi:AcrR family transcriptional regulator